MTAARTVSLLTLCAALAVTAVGKTTAVAQSTPRCGAADLAGAIIDVQGAAGSRFGRMILINMSSRTCHSKGFIGGQLIATNGQLLSTHVHRDQRDTPRTVIIKPGAATALTVHWSVIPSGNMTCRTARWLRVTPPDQTTSLRVYFGDTACRGDLDVGALTNPAAV